MGIYRGVGGSRIKTRTGRLLTASVVTYAETAKVGRPSTEWRQFWHRARARISAKRRGIKTIRFAATVRSLAPILDDSISGRDIPLLSE